MHCDDPKFGKFIAELIQITEQLQSTDQLMWRSDGDDVQMFALCNDVFCWGCADGEAIYVDDLPAIKQAVEDCKGIGEYEDSTGLTLWIARKRGCRPQGAWMKLYPQFVALFSAVGPEVPVRLGNPVAWPEVANATT